MIEWEPVYEMANRALGLKRKSEYAIQSKCGRFKISKAKVRGRLVFTVWKGREALKYFKGAEGAQQAKDYCNGEM